MIFSMHYVTPFVQKRDVEDDLFYIHPIVIIYSTFSDGNLLKMGRRHEKKSYTSHNAYFTSKSGLKNKISIYPLAMSHANRDKEAFVLCSHISKRFFVSIHRAKPVTKMQRQRNRGTWRTTLHLTIQSPTADKSCSQQGVLLAFYLPLHVFLLAGR